MLVCFLLGSDGFEEGGEQVEGEEHGYAILYYAMSYASVLLTWQ
jgi:hypothetical protein